MLNPFGTQREPNLFSYVNLQKRMYRRVQSANVNDQIFLAVMKAYEDALSAEQIFLTRPERTPMLYQILKKVLDDMLRKMNKGSA